MTRERSGALTRLAAMPRRLQISLLAPAAALALVGCGSGDDGTIPQENGNELLSLLETLQSSANSGDCESLAGLAAELQVQIQDLPAEVDPKVKTELLDAAANLAGLSTDDPPECADSGATGEDGLETTTTSTQETTTEEAPVEPTPEEPTEEESAPSEDEEADSPPQDDGAGPPSDTPGNGDPGGNDTPSESGGITGAFEE